MALNTIKDTSTFTLEQLKLARVMRERIGENVEQLGILMTTGGIAKCYIYFGKQFGDFLQNWSYMYHMTK